MLWKREGKRRSQLEKSQLQSNKVTLSSGSMLATDDRYDYPSTRQTEQLARSILKRAKKSASEYIPGTEFSIEITEPHPEVHMTSLMLVLMSSLNKKYDVTYLTIVGGKTVQFRA